ncbi:MAG: ATP phosphoribosyltransferase regulatory subunit, partial [Methylococcales bacterium]|nr:ATP phosphoribosyltransferase regulatory subunit [Methylococcales bacterium]
MLEKDPWLLPDGIEEMLPDDAAHLENLRRQLLDVFKGWGYQLVIPPLMDHLASLLTGTGHDLELQTFKVTDQLSGELLGFRADMTPQVARIDAHNLSHHDAPTRLCYAGSVLHTLSEVLEQSRSPMQIGAEIYGHQGLESDLEVIKLMLEMLTVVKFKKVHLDLGHVGIYEVLSKQAGLNDQQESELFDVLQRKATTELQVLINKYPIEAKFKKIFLALPQLNGNVDILAHATEILKDTGAEIKQALKDLRALSEHLMPIFPELSITFDLAELRGYHYHTGIVFSAFTTDFGREIARGGRYDNIGSVFGRARPATGFSADLRLLTSLQKRHTEVGAI